MNVIAVALESLGSRVTTANAAYARARATLSALRSASASRSEALFELRMALSLVESVLAECRAAMEIVKNAPRAGDQREMRQLRKYLASLDREFKGHHAFIGRWIDCYTERAPLR